MLVRGMSVLRTIVNSVISAGTDSFNFPWILFDQEFVIWLSQDETPPLVAVVDTAGGCVVLGVVSDVVVIESVVVEAWEVVAADTVVDTWNDKSVIFK